MIRRIAEATAVLATFVALVATGPAPRNDCKVESLTFQANTTCGAAGALTLNGTAECRLSAGGAAASSSDLPTSGYFGAPEGLPPGTRATAIAQGFVLERYTPDGGSRRCTGTPADGGMSLQCEDNCVWRSAGDGGGAVTCDATCGGGLTP